MSTDSRRPRQTRWNHPAFTLSLMTILAAAAVIGGKVILGLYFLGLGLLITLAVQLGVRRSERFRETFEADERWGLVDMKAGRLAALTMGGVLIAGLAFELAHGRSLDPWATAVLVVGGLTYSGAQVILSRRS